MKPVQPYQAVVLDSGAAERLLECLARLFPEEHEEDIGLYGRQIFDALLDNETYRQDRDREARKT